ncbi:uncharacterized protein BDR25DRAFT_316403 [Lindgomyces ingoldianus]|uniref:Uncharacterized protein n=1 Tax=Lindgomyces ingoldianus TaxID=673940 RepID=A0ACB6QQ49_9PLEO|nr:uncharacterized protein BDR25DRAFT_316403 [Lindgomyces ingoldianus]KAF2468291.1 hypothetical protein BDR25DRAFT_316403 [Lindgomyces ingoldianus]
MAEPSKLLHAPRDVIKLMLEELNQSDREGFKKFRLVSKTCRRESEFLFFRTVALHDKTPSAKDASFAVMRRLADNQDSIVHLVWDLRVGPIGDEQWFYFEIHPALQDMIGNCTNIQSFTWLTHHGTGAGYGHYSAGRDPLTLFHKTQPSARLDVVYRDRQYTPIDRALLSSPQLHTLDINAYYDSSDSFGRSELQILKKCLVEGNSVKVLRLGFDGVWLPRKYSEHDPRVRFQDWEGVTTGKLNFHWQRGDRFPALEELKIQYPHYQFTPDHCNMWARVMDWSKLRKLDLNRGSPRHLFAALKDQLPNLKYLKFGIWGPNPGNSTWDLQPLDTGLPILSAFIVSITALNELRFKSFAYEDFMAALSIILEHQGAHLKRLDISCRAYGMNAWKVEQYMEVLGKAPDLEYMKAKIKDGHLEGTWEDGGRALDPWDKFLSAVKNDKVVPEQKLSKKGEKKATGDPSSPYKGVRDARPLAFRR